MKLFSRQIKKPLLAFVLASAFALTGTLHLGAQETEQNFIPINPEAFESRDATLFKDDSFTSLRPSATPDAIRKMSDPFLKDLAASMKKGTYELKKRARTYEAYEPVDDLSKRLRTSTYSRFENPTGIYFEEGEDPVVYVKGIENEKVEFKVYNFGSEGTGQQNVQPLKNGLNILKGKNKGLGYISYYTPNYQKAPKVSVHVLNGKVNGVFDSSVSTNQDWKKMLENAPCEVIDIVGKRVHLVYPVKELKETCPDDGLKLINLYDQIIGHQHQIMGLVKYNIQPKNRMLGRVIWKGFMHADGMGAAFHNGTMREVGNPEVVPKSSWGIAHEFGHVNQTRPVMMWVSTTEVTNNLFSAWSNYILNPTGMRLESERINGGDGNVIGGRFNAYLNSALIDGSNWLCQKGPDSRPHHAIEGMMVQDHFVKLGPLWQLQLYFTAAKRGNPDFLADVFQTARAMKTEGKSNGDYQLAFMKNVCDATKTDLSDFFIRVGMLKPIDEELDDYSIGRMTITKAQCSNLVKYAQRYPKPESPVIYYISVNSVEAYKNKLPLEGRPNQGVTDNGNHTLTISHKSWKNAAVFETYKNDQLIKIAMVGTDSPDNSSTLVQYPEGATKVVAVGWNGKRALVYGK